MTLESMKNYGCLEEVIYSYQVSKETYDPQF